MWTSSMTTNNINWKTDSTCGKLIISYYIKKSK